MTCHLILYVQDQELSTAFYTAVLARNPDLHVPGMTEFHLGSDVVFGLMSVTSIKRLLGSDLPDPAHCAGVPRAELYLKVPDADAHHARALAKGARELSPLRLRDWGDSVAYSLDRDGHVLAFAEQR